jgi:hypothetical protein
MPVREEEEMILRPWYDIKEVEELIIEEFVTREISTAIQTNTEEAATSTDKTQDDSNHA